MDVGNTHIVLGRFESGRVLDRYRLETRTGMTADELLNCWSMLLDVEEPETLELLVASVVPEITKEIRALDRDTSLEARFLEPPWTSSPIDVGTDHPERVGADRVAGSVAFHEEFGGGVIVDFGTATTLDLVSAEGVYRGGVIFPGIEASAHGLSEQAALLPQVTTEPPGEISFTDTQSGLRSGLFYGTAGAVERLIDELLDQSDLPGDAPVVATGGGSRQMAHLIGRITHVRRDLVLHGLMASLGKG